MPTFNLIDEEWIPCLMSDGRQRDLSLREALASAHEVRELFDASPLVTAALHRLLLTALLRSLAPRSLSDWTPLWHARRWDEQTVGDYLAQWRHRFDLFDAERPFYQQAGFTTKRATPLKRLGWEFAAGNNATLFDHSVDAVRPEVLAATAARWLVATQSFAASAGKSETLHTKDSPWTRGAVILAQGDNLFETLALNLLSLLKPDFPSFEDDKPAWEEKTPWEAAHDLTPKGLLEYLTWQSRSVRLLPLENGRVRECYFAQGRGLRDSLRNDPMFAYRRDEKLGLIVWQFNEDKAVWRDSHALLNVSTKAPFQLPQATHHIATLARQRVVDRHRLFQLQVMGQALEPGKPTIRFWRNERLPLRVEYLNEPLLLEQLKHALQLAEDTAQVINQAVWRLAKLMLAPNSEATDGSKPSAQTRQPDKKDVQNVVKNFGAAAFYWSRLEPPFKQLLLDLPEDESADEDGEVEYGGREMRRWARTLRDTATEAFRVATRSLDISSRSLKAAATAERLFRSKLRTTLADYLQAETNEPAPETGGTAI
jgi:CRISPR system Cascade subunit CasA